LVQGNVAFGLDLYGRLKQPDGNLFLSPYSISTCLAMTYAGARGNTEQQMAQVLHLGQKQAQVHAAFGDLQRQLNATAGQKGIELSIANALWAQKGHAFLPEFIGTATRQYEAKLKQADFITAAEPARREINQWVSGKTKGRIQDILAPGILTEATRLVLADAIYFKGVWTTRFDQNSTRTQPFYVSASRSVQAPLMFHTDKVKYMENDMFQAVELPYAGGELAMVILLPQQASASERLEALRAEEGHRRPMLPQQAPSCERLEGALDAASLAGWLGQMKRQEVDLFVPKFKIESTFALAPVLENMGMPDAFHDKADFSGMDGATNLYISSVSHKAWVEVAEEGTEAAAATVVAVHRFGMSSPRMPPPHPVFRADHPFLFLIRDTRSGSVLFLGRLMDPNH
jgi:serpin B